MSRRVSPRLANVWRYVLVGSLALSLGGAATVTAAGPAISGFVGLIDGDNTAAISASRELSVSVGNFPATQAVNGTVGLSPTANTVRVTPANTVLALSELGVSLGNSPIPGTVPALDRTIDVSSYERIRVVASNHKTGGDCFGHEPIVVQITFGAVGAFDSFTLNQCDFAQKVYEVPGTTLRIRALVPEVLGQAVFNLQVFGR